MHQVVSGVWRKQTLAMLPDTRDVDVIETWRRGPTCPHLAAEQGIQETTPDPDQPFDVRRGQVWGSAQFL